MSNQNKNFFAQRAAAFTLIELLVVIAILGLIAGLVGPQVMKQFAGAKADTARLQIADLSAGLDLFFIDLGRYPTTEEGLAVLRSASDGIDEWNGPYLKGSIPNDPWGRPYDYRSAGTPGSVEIVSLGADQKPGGAGDDADITSLD